MEQFVSLFTRLVVALEVIAANFGSAPTAAATGGTDKGGATGTKTTKATKAAADKGATAPTQEEVNAALSELKDYIDSKGEKGIVHARKVMKEVAGVEKMVEIPEEKRAAVIKAAAKELEAYKAAEEEEAM